MKTRIIDILNKMADGTLEDGFKFGFRGETYTYNKQKDKLEDTEGYTISSTFQTEYYLTDEVEVIEDVKKIEEIKVIDDDLFDENNNQWFIDAVDRLIINKINELVRAVNELRKVRNNE